MSPARIGLIGGECTGKTTTATDLAGRFAAAVTPEALRDFVIRHGRTPRAEEQRPIMREQRAQYACPPAPRQPCSLCACNQ